MDSSVSPEPASSRSRRFRGLGLVGLLGLLWTAMPAICGILLLAYLGPVSDWLLAHAAIGLAVYVLVFIVSGGMGMLPTYAQAILGGWVFGLQWGLLGALTGFTGAAMLGYAIARRVSRDRVVALVQSNAKAEAIRKALIGGGFWRTLGVVALLRLPPNSPFALTNLAMASTGVPLWPYALGTLLGMVPRTGIAVFFAASAAATGARDIQSFIKDGPGTMIFVGGLFVMLIVLGILARIANGAIARLEQNHRRAGEKETADANGPADREQLSGAGRITPSSPAAGGRTLE